MFSTLGRYGLPAVRSILVVAGTGLLVVAVRALVTIPPASPDSDGFVTGGAYLLWAALSVLSLGVVGFGVALPTLLGTDDPLGFGHYQRAALKASGLVLAGGVVVGAVGLASNSFFGMLFALLVVLSGALGVCCVLVWRLGELVRHRLAPTIDDTG